MTAKLVCLALAVGFACLALVASVAPPHQTDRDHCLKKAAVYLSGLTHDSSKPNDQNPWIAILEKSRQFYPNIEEFLATSSPKEGYVEAMLSMGVLYGFATIDDDCKLIIDQVNDMPAKVPCFESQSESPVDDLQELMREWEDIKPVIERYLICHYVANRI